MPTASPAATSPSTSPSPHASGPNSSKSSPDWRSFPDPIALKARIADAGLAIWSAHGGWGGQAILASRIDLGSLDEATRAASVDDLKRSLDWLRDAGGSHLVVHPGGLSDATDRMARREALIRSLHALADHVAGSHLVACVENMPPGVHPGSKMAEIAEIVAEVGRQEIRIALDTGHGNLVATADSETLAAGSLLATTHVHDNNGRSDSHLPPGLGTVDWDAWTRALDDVGYRGPVMLECIRHLREKPASLDETLRERLARLVGRGS